MKKLSAQSTYETKAKAEHSGESVSALSVVASRGRDGVRTQGPPLGPNAPGAVPTKMSSVVRGRTDRCDVLAGSKHDAYGLTAHASGDCVPSRGGGQRFGRAGVARLRSHRRLEPAPSTRTSIVHRSREIGCERRDGCHSRVQRALGASGGWTSVAAAQQAQKRQHLTLNRKKGRRIRIELTLPRTGTAAGWSRQLSWCCWWGRPSTQPGPPCP